MRARATTGPLAVLAVAGLTAGTLLGYLGAVEAGVALVLLALAAAAAMIGAPAGDGEHLALMVVGVVFTAVLVADANLPLGLALVGVVAAIGYRLLRAGRWWLATLPAWILQLAALRAQWRWGSAAIDVFYTLQAATSHLLAGADPYSFTYRDLDPVPRWHFVSAPFQYGPATLLLSVPGRLLGDVRLLDALAAAALVGLLLWLAARRGRANLQRTTWLLATSPLLVPMIVNAWVDLYTATGVVAWWALRQRHWRWAALVLGAGAAVKPVMLAALIPLLVWDGAVRREVAAAAVAAVVICVPFAVWTGPVRFVYDVAGVHVSVLNAVWPNAVTVDALLVKYGLAPVPDGLFIAALVLGLLAATRWRPARDHSRLVAGAVLLVIALLLSRQSFLNYYFGAVVWMLLATTDEPGPAMAEEPAQAEDPRVRKFTAPEPDHGDMVVSFERHAGLHGDSRVGRISVQPATG